MLVSESSTEQKTHPQLRTGRALKIAIDGPAGAGKSTVARKVANALGYLYIDTGAMYRAATWLVIDKNLPVGSPSAITKAVGEAKIELRLSHSQLDEVTQVFVNNHEVTNDIRTQKVTQLVSLVSAIEGVRKHLVKQQRKIAHSGSVVLDGRDIGTVVLPDAELKIFLTASPEIRAHRRLKELEAKGENVQYESLLKEITERDRFDSTRAIAPLRIADDAIAIFTDHLAVDEVVEKIIALCS